MDQSLSECYLLDTCVATFVLDSELWHRSPPTLMEYRRELYAAWSLAGEPKEVGDAIPFNENLAKAVKAFEWVQRRIQANSPPLLLCPTVEEELNHTPQVQI